MRSHIKALGILHLVHAGLAVLFGLCMMLLFGGIAALVGIAGHDRDSAAAVPVLGAIGSLIMVVAFVLALPKIAAGIGLLYCQNWARILTIIISIIGLMDFPFGTALGVYGLWVLLSPEGTALFTAQPRPA